MTVNIIPMKAEHVYSLCEKDGNAEVVAESTYLDVKHAMIDNNLEIKEEVDVDMIINFDDLEDELPTHRNIFISHTLHINRIIV